MKWISTKDRMPTKEDSPILIYQKNSEWYDLKLNYVAVHWIEKEDIHDNDQAMNDESEGGWYEQCNFFQTQQEDILYWMPLPKQPENL